MSDSPTPPAPRFLVLVPAGDEFHIATRDGRLLTTTERTQIGLGRIEGRRPPVISADNVGALPTVDLLQVLTDQVQPAAAAPSSPSPAAKDEKATAAAAG